MQQGFWGPIGLDKDQIMVTEVALERPRSSRVDNATLRCSVVHQEGGQCDIALHSGVKVCLFLLSPAKYSLLNVNAAEID